MIKIIGITGPFGSGKTEAAAFFSSHGFTSVSLVSFLEEELKARKIKTITRKKLQDLGNQWRKKYGGGVLAKKAIEFVNKKKAEKTVIGGIRNPKEIEQLKKAGKFILLGIVLDRKIRFERLKKLKRREALTWEIFEKLDRRDLGLGQKKTGLHVAACLAMADVFIENNGNLEEFRKKLEEVLRNYG